MTAVGVALGVLLVIGTWRARNAGRELLAAAEVLAAEAWATARTTADLDAARALDHEALVLDAETRRPSGPSARAVRQSMRRVQALLDRVSASGAIMGPNPDDGSTDP